MLRVKFIPLNAYRKDLKKLDKEEQTKPNASRKNEIIKVDVNKIEKKKNNKVRTTKILFCKNNKIQINL